MYKKWMEGWGLDAAGFSKNWAAAMVHNMVATQGHGCRYSLIHAKSVQGALSFPTASLDVAFIDGLHTYEGVVEDLKAWRPKLKEGGLMLFNDYDDPHFPGCVRTSVGVNPHYELYLALKSFCTRDRAVY